MELVLNWIWQGLLIAATTAAVLRLLAPTSARLRYRLLWASLMSVAMLPLVPLLAVMTSDPVPVAAAPGVRTAMLHLPGTYPLADRTVALLCGLWVLASAWQLLRAAVAVRRARRACDAFPADLEARLPRWTDLRASHRRARLATCAAVRSAGVLPGRDPVIAVSPRLLETLTEAELDRVVVHEWAHIRRWDDLAHLAQALVTACIGWHPAIWWCGRQLHLEREMACDEIAVTLTGSRKAYAACLARLATLPPTNGHALPIVAAVSASGVRRRIVRVLAFDAARAGRFHVVAASVAAVALLTLSPYASALRVVAAHPAAEQAPRAPVPPDVATAGAVPVEASSSSPLPPRPVTGPGDRTAITAAPNAAPVPAAAATMRRASEAQPASANTTVMTAAEAPAFLSSRQLGATTIDPPATVVASAAAAPRAGPALASAAGAAPGAGGQSTGSPVTVSPPWTAAAGAGVAIGDTAQSAAQATAGFFNRLGRKIAGSL